MLTDPIAALATPPGRSALAVIRLSGAGAFEVARRVIAGFEPAPRRATLSWFQDAEGQPLDRGVYTVYPGPHSYTGEDLVEAEAVGDLIDATAPAQAMAALRQLDGSLSQRLAALRESLVEVQALLSYDIDFPEEDDGAIPPQQIADRIAAVSAQIRQLVATAPSTERFREGALM